MTKRWLIQRTFQYYFYAFDRIFTYFWQIEVAVLIEVETHLICEILKCIARSIYGVTEFAIEFIDRS